MLHNISKDRSLETLTAAIGAEAADRDRDGHFPSTAFASLDKLGLIARAPVEDRDAGRLFRLLAAIGRGDLSVGRIFEGHVNALFLARKFGTEAQRERFEALAARGNIFGVWNTDLPGEAVTLEGMRLSGKKSFASGADGISHAVITAAQQKGRLMTVVPITACPIDRSWWHPLGMRASGSHVVDFTGVIVEPDAILGKHDDYIREPWFSAGALRFAAVHVGGMHAVFAAAVAHLRTTRRLKDPYQCQRVGRMGIAVEAGYAWLDRGAEAWRQASGKAGSRHTAEGIVSVANASRLAIENHALTVLEEAERGVGAAGFIAPHPLERLVRDLRTYLRQPNPDGALASLGSAIADGDWAPGDDFGAQRHERA